MAFRSFAFLCSLCVLGGLCVTAFSGPAQQEFADAAEISRALLYQPARRIEASAEGILFRAERFSYRLRGGAWGVAAEQNFPLADWGRTLTSYRAAGGRVELRFRGTSTEDEGLLEIRVAGPDGESAESLTLWTRQALAAAWLDRLRQDDPGLTRERFARDYEAAEPEVAAVAEGGGMVWLAIRHYAGEGLLGIGTLVGINLETGEKRVVQPGALATASLTHVALAGGQLWLGTHREREGGIESAAGLVRLDPAGGEVASFVPETSPLVGRIVTALASDADNLFVATDAGLCRIAQLEAPPPAWSCWRVVPRVKLAAAASVSDRPGGPPRGRLAAGSYEVRWANAAFFEVVTPDAAEGWMETDDLEEYTARGFDLEPYLLENALGNGAGVMRLLAEPGGDPLAAAQVYRAGIERVGLPGEAGWQRVRARVGWIRRDRLEVVPAIVPGR